MRRFLVKFLWVAAPLFLLLTGVNYFGDAANLFSSRYVKKLAAEITKGNNVTHVTNCDERDLQRHLITHSPVCRQIAVIGSSRVMEIRSAYFKDSTLLNNGVSGASIEDLFAVTELYEQKKCFPVKIIIGLDPWTLNKNSEQTRWRTWAAENDLFAKRLNIGTAAPGLKDRIKNRLRPMQNYSELISPSYFQNSLQSLVSNAKQLELTKETVNHSFTRLSDGSVGYGYSYRVVSPVERDKRVSEYLTGNIYGINNFDRIDEEICKKIDLLTAYLVKKGVVVEFFLAPYHPQVYEKISANKRYQRVLESEAFFTELAKKYNIRLRGSFNPDALQLKETDFYDGMHCDDIAIQKILHL